MSDYQESLKRINEILTNATASIYQTQKSIHDSLAPVRAIQDMKNKMLQPYQEMFESIHSPLSSSIAEVSNRISRELNDALATSFNASLSSKELTETFHHIAKHYVAPTLISISSNHMYDFPENLGGLPADDDFVTVDETAVKEYEVPDSIAIPIGHGRLKMKTSDFLSILSIIISMIVSISIAVAQSNQSPTETEVQQLQIERTQKTLLQSQNQMLCNLLHDIDTTSSSQAEFLQSLKENVEAQSTAISDLGESLDSIQQLLDSMNESENTEPEIK